MNEKDLKQIKTDFQTIQQLILTAAHSVTYVNEWVEVASQDRTCVIRLHCCHPERDVCFFSVEFFGFFNQNYLNFCRAKTKKQTLQKLVEIYKKRIEEVFPAIHLEQYKDYEGVFPDVDLVGLGVFSDE